MGILDKTPAELNAMTLTQIKSAILAEQQAIKTEQRISTIKSQSGDKRGQIEHTTETRDGLRVWEGIGY